MISKLLPLAVAAVASLALPLAAAEATLHTFKKQHLEKFYWSEGAALGDLNRDGKPDAIYGPYWWEGPDFTKRHEIYAPAKTTTVKNPDGTSRTFAGWHGGMGNANGYSNDNFFAFVHDFDGDGWNDVLTYGLPHTPAYLFLNPAGRAQLWVRHTVLDEVDNESPTFVDLTGDGKPEIVCVNNGNFGYAAPDWNNPTAKWKFTPISAGGTWQRYTHGLGVGDMNADGRLDVLFKDGWFEQPASLAGDPAWKLHKTFFAPGGAQMFAYDVNGDGRTDVITALAAHGFGFAWYEQLAEKAADGELQFKPHIFLNKEPRENRYGVVFSEIHAVELIDMDGDGLKDIVTGKCFWAHGPPGTNIAAPDAGAPAVLYWFKLVRHADGTVDWVPNLIDDNSGVGRQVGLGDVNGDGRPDLIIGNKKGAYVFVNEARAVSRAEWARAQPRVLYPDAEKSSLTARDVIVHTARATQLAGAATSAAPATPAVPIVPSAATPAAQVANPAAPSAPAPARRPNIILIFADDLGWKDVGWQGSDFNETPHLDRLAQSGMVFSNAYAAAGNCAPSRACLLSGTYTPRHHVYAVQSTERGPKNAMRLVPVPNRSGLAKDNVTIADALRAAGYATGIFGKWHLDGPEGAEPGAQGFGTVHQSYHAWNDAKADEPQNPKGIFSLTRGAMEFMEKNRDRPFFLYLPHYAIHTGLQARPETLARFEKKKRGAQHGDPLYAACLYDLDAGVGQLMEKLASLGLEQNTLVVFTSDNGGTQKSSQEPLRGNKGGYYEGGIREPFIARWPGVIKPGTRSDTPIVNVDLFPTFLAAAGVAVPAGKILDGENLLPLLRGTGPLARQSVFWHFPGYLNDPVIRGRDLDVRAGFRSRPVSVIRQGDWKLHLFHEEWQLDGGREKLATNRAVELYHLAADPGEHRDLANTEPARRDALLADLLAWIKSTGALLPTQPNPAYDPATALAEGKKEKAKNKK